MNRGWPTYILNGRLRTSTVALIVAFLLVWWLYEINQPEATPAQEAPATQVVPPGFVPDPNYTWVPRTDVLQPTATTTSSATPTMTTPTETTSPTSPTDTTTSGSPTTSPTTTTPAPPGAPPASPSPAMPGPGPSPTPSS